MIRTALFLSGLLAGACAGPAPAPAPPVPDWSGPAVQARHLDRGLDVVLLAPTGGHSFDLQRVESSGDRVDLHFVHRLPGLAFQPQVVTPLLVNVDAARLGAARAVFVWIASVEYEAMPSREQLAIALARP